jgi:hypothetical protein
MTVLFVQQMTDHRRILERVWQLNCAAVKRGMPEKCDGCWALTDEPTSKPPHGALMNVTYGAALCQIGELHYRCKICGTRWQRVVPSLGYSGPPLVWEERD